MWSSCASSAPSRPVWPGPVIVDEIRAKPLQSLADETAVPQKEEIEMQVPLEVQHKTAVRNFERLEFAVPAMARFRTRMHAKERKFAAARKPGEFATGQRNPVHLLVAVGEESDARGIHSTASSLISAPNGVRRPGCRRALGPRAHPKPPERPTAVWINPPPARAPSEPEQH